MFSRHIQLERHCKYCSNSFAEKYFFFFVVYLSAPAGLGVMERTRNLLSVMVYFVPFVLTNVQSGCEFKTGHVAGT